MCTIALATWNKQTVVWKENKPKKTKNANWHMIAHVLRRRRSSASVTRFDGDFATRFGLVCMDELFA